VLVGFVTSLNKLRDRAAVLAAGKKNPPAR
jgi:hypothetical protein